MITILAYHSIVSDGDSLEKIPVNTRPYCLSKGHFIEQLNLLTNKGFKGISASHVYGEKEGLAVGITFDDGLESDYFVSFPELQKRGFHATFYIITDCVGERGYMNWEQIIELNRNGMEIGSHSVTHPCLLDLDEDTLLRELTQSKQILEDRLGICIESFGVPFGFVNEKVIRTALEVGYKTVCTSETRLADAVAIPKIYGRYAIRRGDSMKVFKGIVGKQASTLLKISFKEECKNFLKSFMGRQVWLAFREKILRSRLL